MDPSIELNRNVAPAAKGGEGTKNDAISRVNRSEAGSRLSQRSATPTTNKDRLSVDPLRSTDRYRLVLPIDGSI